MRALFGSVCLVLVLGCDAKSPSQSTEPALAASSTAAPLAAAPTSPPAPPAAAAPTSQPAPHAAAARAPASQAAPASQPAPTASPSDVAPSAAAGERSFGAGLKLDGPPLAVAQVMADPTPHLGKVIQCEGVVSRVCERAGCWLELRPDAAEQGLRVPMAGHAFFIPQDAVGHRAVVEGELKARPLSPGELAHLQGEGLAAVGPLSLAATAVVVR